MPTVKIELLAGRNQSELMGIKDVVMDSVVEVLHIPADDRNIRILEYQPGFFELKPPYKF